MFIFGVTEGFRRTTVIGIPPKGMEGNISIIFIITNVAATKMTTEKLFFAVDPPPPQQWWTPIATIISSKWTKEALCY